MTEPLGAIEILGLAGSVSLLSGWRLYLCMLATGLAMYFNFLPLPHHLDALRILANPWIMGVAGLAAIFEFFADKIPWVDSIWDAVHTVIRPLGGAMLSLAIVDPSEPVTQVVAFILGGGASLLAHGGKAATRALANTSPEPFSNIALSTTEDIVTAGGLYFIHERPMAAGLIALFLLALAVTLLLVVRKILKRILGTGGDDAGQEKPALLADAGYEQP